MAVKAGGVELAVRAVGGVWSACEGFGGVVWGLMAVLWAGAEECCSGRAVGGAGEMQECSGGRVSGIIESISADPLLNDERPQRLDARSREVGVGHTEDFADGCGAYGREN